MNTRQNTDMEQRAHADHHASLRLWLRLLSCTTRIEDTIRQRLREQFGITLPRFDLMAQLEREPEGLAMGEVSRRMMNEKPQRGRWQFQGGGGGRVTSVRFNIVSSDPTTLSGLAYIIAWDYGFSKTQIPATIAGNTVIEICDPMGCFLNEPNVDLTNRAGVAVYRDADVIDNCRTGYAPFPGVWEVTSLCCKLLSCDVVI